MINIFFTTSILCALIGLWYLFQVISLTARRKHGCKIEPRDQVIWFFVPPTLGVTLGFLFSMPWGLGLLTSVLIPALLSLGQIGNRFHKEVTLKRTLLAMGVYLCFVGLCGLAIRGLFH